MLGQRNVQDIGAADLQPDGLVGDALVAASHVLGLLQDLLPDLIEVVEDLACSMVSSECCWEHDSMELQLLQRCATIPGACRNSPKGDLSFAEAGVLTCMPPKSLLGCMG